MYRKREGELEFLLVHPGGPFFAKKDEGVWSIPKGEVEEEEDCLSAAKREFEEETSIKSEGDFITLGSIQGGGLLGKNKSRKTIYVWAFEGDCDPQNIISNTFSMEWPPHSGKQQEFPENDRANFFSYEEAVKKILPAQIMFLDRLREKLR
jgi:predicted NUDIX family NTP pyrophosphohydrolase